MAENQPATAAVQEIKDQEGNVKESNKKNSRVELWKSRGRFVTFKGHQIFTFHQQGSSEGEREPLLLLLHGYPNSSKDWEQYINKESSKTILTFDFLGFGLSDKPTDHNYSLLWQADLTEFLVKEYCGDEKREIIFIAHDMGTSVATELMARDIENKLQMNLIGGVLFNGNMDMSKSSLIFGQKLLRSPIGSMFAKLTQEWSFKWQLGTVFSKKFPMTREEGEDQWTLLSRQNGHRLNHKLIRYTFEREQLAERWLGAIRDWEKSLEFLWGMADPVATIKQFYGLKDLRPSAKTTELEELGHFPHIEDVDTFNSAMEDILERIVNVSKQH